MGGRIMSLMLKELIQFSRDKVILGVILWMYTLEVVLCGYGMTFEVKQLPIAVVDHDQSAASRALIEKFDLSEAFTVATYATSQEDAALSMRKGDAQYGLIIPPDFQSMLKRGESPSMQVLLDGTNSNAATLAKDYTAQIVALFESEFRENLGAPTTVRPVVQIWYNRTQTLESFVVLSMIAVAALMVGSIHPAASIMREKEVGTIEQLMVTPTKVWEIFIAKTLPTLGVGLLAIFPSLLVIWWFGVPLKGSLLLFVVLTVVFLLSAIAIGVLIAAITRTLQQTLLLCFFGLFPMLFLSGNMTPIESMPPFLQNFTAFSPLRYYMDVILGIFLKGSGMAELWSPVLHMAGLGVLLFSFAAWVFKRNMA